MYVRLSSLTLSRTEFIPFCRLLGIVLIVLAFMLERVFQPERILVPGQGRENVRLESLTYSPTLPNLGRNRDTSSTCSPDRESPHRERLTRQGPCSLPCGGRRTCRSLPRGEVSG